MLNNTAKSLIADLEQDIKDLRKFTSNIELIWALEKLNKDKVFLLSANLLRKSLN